MAGEVQVTSLSQANVIHVEAQEPLWPKQQRKLDVAGGADGRRSPDRDQSDKSSRPRNFCRWTSRCCRRAAKTNRPSAI